MRIVYFQVVCVYIHILLLFSHFSLTSNSSWPHSGSSWQRYWSDGTWTYTHPTWEQSKACLSCLFITRAAYRAWHLTIIQQVLVDWWIDGSKRFKSTIIYLKVLWEIPPEYLLNISKVKNFRIGTAGSKAFHRIKYQSIKKLLLSTYHTPSSVPKPWQCGGQRDEGFVHKYRIFKNQ